MLSKLKKGKLKENFYKILAASKLLGYLRALQLFIWVILKINNLTMMLVILEKNW